VNERGLVVGAEGNGNVIVQQDSGSNTVQWYVIYVDQGFRAPGIGCYRNQGDYKAGKLPLESCKCHSSCVGCGFTGNPVREIDCITC